MQGAPPDPKAWKQKVHTVDMALRTIREEAANERPKEGRVRATVTKRRLPFLRASSSSQS